MARHVAVIGAGYAGLTAARTLVAEGVEVTVLEARDRVGGRALTQTTASGAVVDLGAQWIGRPHERLLALAAHFGIATVAAPAGETTLHLDGRATRIGPAMVIRMPRTALALSRSLSRLGRLARTVPDATPWSAEGASELDAQSLAELIAATTRRRDAARIIDDMTSVWMSTDTDSVSALAALAALSGSGGLAGILSGEAEEWMFDRGSDAVARAMAAELGERVRLETVVDAVSPGGAGVVVSGEWGTLRAERAIIATPSTYAARLVGEQSGYRAGLYHGGIVKAIAVYEAPFWRDAGRSPFTQAPGERVSTTFDVSRGGHGMLAALVPGGAAASLAAETAEIRRELVLDAFARAAGPEARHPLSYLDRAWITDPWTMGGYCELAPPGLLTAERTLGATPLGPVHFAGTETSPEWNGYLEGAVRSGERAAAEVLAAL